MSWHPEPSSPVLLTHHLSDGTGKRKIGTNGQYEQDKEARAHKGYLLVGTSISECAFTLVPEWSDPSVTRDGRARPFLVAVTDTQLDLEHERECTGLDLTSRECHTPQAVHKAGVHQTSGTKTTSALWPSPSSACLHTPASFFLRSVDPLDKVSNSHKCYTYRLLTTWRETNPKISPKSKWPMKVLLGHARVRCPTPDCRAL